MNFFEFITGLAPQGETALLVKQKPVMRNGEQLTHADGTPKFTWPAYLPKPPREEGAWYINTGSFIIDRFHDGKPGASAANCEYVLCMMLDDIGTKSKTPPLAPTWIMETSEGSFQWGYAFSDQPSKGEFTAAIKAIADAGYTDPGATNAVRNFRIPGSINLKPGRNNFAARLVEFHPEREYTLPQICEALGVTPAPADTSSYSGIRLRDTGKDTVLEWLNDKGLVLSHQNAEGWLSVICPNKDEHSDGQISGRYNPVTRAYCCYHSHCEGLDSNAFLKWVCDNGGPRATPGLRDELLAEHMARMQEKLAPNTMFKDDAKQAITEAENRELARVEKSAWYERFAYVVENDSYFDLETRRELSRASFNAIYRHVPCVSVHNGRRVEAATCFDENRVAHNARILQNLTYAAGESVLVVRDGDVLGNRWMNARPDVSGVRSSDISRWLSHAEVLIPDAEAREHTFNMMAFKVQNPNIKINHAVLHGGDEGSGKDTLWAPFIWAVCGPHSKNRGLVDNDSLTSQWGYQLESEILILNELKEPEAKERRALANKLKPIIAAPPEMLPINRKGLHPYDMVNRMFVLAFTNDPVPISIPSQDRRWFCVWSTAPRMDPDAAREMWDWYRAGGFQVIARWLHDRDVSAFNPSAAPPVTEFKLNLVEHGMTIAESFLTDMIRLRSGEFAKGVIGSPFYAVCERLSSLAPSGVKVPQAALLHALKEAGWKDMGRLASAKYSTKKQIFCAPDLVNWTKTDLRNAVEDATPPAPKVVNLR